MGSARIKIVSFGDSFVYGSELEDNVDGHRAWPGRIAADLGCDYETRAIPGCGNDAIARQVVEYFATNHSHNTLAVINWTWALRWDFYVVSTESWVTLGPTCVPSKLHQHMNQADSRAVLDVYEKFTGHSSTWEKWRSLNSMFVTQQFLRQRGITSIETYMDPELVDSDQHAPAYSQALLDLTRPSLRTWDGMTFLEWCRHHDYPITQPGLHPLEQAHSAAADFWRADYAQALAR